MVLEWVKACRPLNLLIISLIQVLLYYKLFWEDGYDSILNGAEVGLLILITCLITIGGYLINDFYDKQTDTINSKANKHTIAKRKLWIGYLSVCLLGLILSIYLGNRLGMLHFLPLYAIAIALLFYYSYKAKGQGLLGNLIVSIFCTCGLLVILLAEWEALEVIKDQNSDAYLKNMVLLIGFSLFAGFITLIRELIKDIEDIVGDSEAGIQTFAVKHGAKRSKALTLTYIILAFLLSVLWSVVSYNFYENSATILFVVLVIPVLVRIAYLLIKANNKANYSKISKGLKVVMLSALMYLFLT